MFVFNDRYHRNLVSAFKKFQDAGRLEIITCAATHGYLPLMLLQPEAVRVQIRAAVEHYRKHLGVSPRGIWLPECAYAPGVDEILKENGLKFFFTDSHGILYASHRPRYGIFAPIFCPTGVAAFGRDIESSKQVWSTMEGYPGDYYYREFYRDIGHDLIMITSRATFTRTESDPYRDEVLRDYRQSGLSQKEPYNPGLPRQKQLNTPATSW